MTPARARAILLAALLLGVTGDLLLRGGEWRLGFFTWVVLGVITVLLATRDEPLASPRTLLLGGVALAASGLVLRESQTLYPIDFLSLLCVGALAVWQGGGRRLATFEVLDAVRASILTAVAVLFGAPGLLRAGAESTDAGTSRAARLRTAVIGVVIAVPPLLVVAGLLGSADPVFKEFMSVVYDIVSQQALMHGFVMVLLAWFAAGWLRSVAGAAPSPALPEVPSPGVEFGSIAVALYGLVALLAIFLGLQVRVLFGGAAYLAATTGLSVAEYARDGFFDLVAVTAVVLGTLLATEWLLDRRRVDAARLFRTAGWALLTLVGVLVLSAFVRMGLYVRHFGLSEDRFFATAAMVWIALALSWFGLTILRGRHERFGPGILVVSTLWVALLNIANPDALVARVNVARAVAGREFDVEYHAKLSADALPVLLALAPSLPTATCEALTGALAQRWATRRHERRDWRSWSLPERRAWRLTSDLDDLARCAPR